MTVIGQEHIRACYEQAIESSGKSVNTRASSVARLTGINTGSARHYNKTIEQMRSGGHYNMTINPFGTGLVLEWIRKDFGADAQRVAAQVVLEHVEYYNLLDTGGPQYNVGKIAENVLLSQLEALAPSAAKRENKKFQAAIGNARADTATARRARLADAKKNPSIYTEIRIVYRRNPDVVAERLEMADCICEWCKATAPFLTKTGRPFLEVHHRIPLAEGGDDTIENAAAIWPNCHREAHFGTEWEKFRP